MSNLNQDILNLLEIYQSKLIRQLETEKNPLRLQYGMDALIYMWTIIASNLKNSPMLLISISVKAIMESIFKNLKTGKQVDNTILRETLTELNRALQLVRKGDEELEEMAHELLFRSQITPKKER